jgi:type I restriction enzyme S subunit
MKPTDALPHPADWQTTTVSDAIEIKRGVSWGEEQEHSEPRDGTIPVIRIGNVQKHLEIDDLIYISGLKLKAIESKRVSKGWSIMVGSNGNRQRVGNAVLIDRDTEFLFASFLLAAKPKDESSLMSSYFYRWLSSEPVQAYLGASSEGSTGLNNLSHSFFRKMAVSYPLLDEQAAIACILDAVDTAIERAQKAVGQAKELKATLIQDFFYSALGVTAYANRPTRKIPAGWSLVPTQSLLAEEPKNGVSPRAASHPPGVPTFSIAAVREGRINLEKTDNLKYTQLPDKIAAQFKINRGDMLIVRGNANPDLVGKAGIIDTFPDRCIYPDITKRVVFRCEGEVIVSPEFAVLTWNHPILHNQILRRAKTSNGTLKVNSRDVKQIVMPVPPAEEQAKLVKLMAAVDMKIKALEKKEAALKELKKSLMHDLLTGTVRVDPSLRVFSDIE